MKLIDKYCSWLASKKESNEFYLDCFTKVKYCTEDDVYNLYLYEPALMMWICIDYDTSTKHIEHYINTYIK